MIVVLARIMVHGQRYSLDYAFSYTGLGEMAANPVYEIGTAYPQLNAYFGLLVGLVYTIPYSFFGLVAGKVTDKVNRKIYLSLVLILAGVTCAATGFFNSFLVLGWMRFFHGMLNSSTNPLTFSLMQDYFPIEKRSTANSLVQAGNYVGVGLSSLAILLITEYGWRGMYGFYAVASLVVGLGVLTLIREPKRGQFLDKAARIKEAEMKAEIEQETAG
jgi:MFS family permease